MARKKRKRYRNSLQEINPQNQHDVDANRKPVHQSNIIGGSTVANDTGLRLGVLEVLRDVAEQLDIVQSARSDDLYKQSYVLLLQTICKCSEGAPQKSRLAAVNQLLRQLSHINQC
jgi:hypothetical protein